MSAINGKLLLTSISYNVIELKIGLCGVMTNTISYGVGVEWSRKIPGVGGYKELEITQLVRV